jgi:hypothetical protein
MIVATMSTIPERRANFCSVLQRMLYEQTLGLDRMYVCLHRYQQIESWLPQDPRIRYYLGKPGEGPWVRYRVAEELDDDDVLLTLDDDTIYPTDYVETGLSDLRRVRDHAVVCYGGLRWDPFVCRFEYYTPYRTLILGSKGVKFPFRLAILQGICTFLRARVARGAIDLKLAGFNTNDDLMMSYHLQRQGVPIHSPAKPEGWITMTEDADASHALAVRDKCVRADTFHRLVYQLGFDPTAGWLEEMRAYPRHVLVLLDAVPCDGSQLHRKLLDLCRSDTMVHVVAKVRQSKLPEVPLPFEFPYLVHPSPVLDEGGRFESVPLVTAWRTRRINRLAQRVYDERVQVFREKLPEATVIDLRDGTR